MNKKGSIKLLYIGLGILLLILISLFVFIKIPEKTLDDKWSDFESKYGEDWNIEINNLTSTPHIISGSNIEIKESITEENIDKISKDFIVENKEIFKIETDNLKLDKIDFDKPLYEEHEQGIATITYSQNYKEIPVYKSLISITYINGRLTTATTDYYPGIDISPEPTITKEEALEITKRDLGITQKIEAKNISLWVFPKELQDKVEYHLTWKVEMPLLNLPTRTIPQLDLPTQPYTQSGQVIEGVPIVGKNIQQPTQLAPEILPKEEPTQWVYFIDAHDSEIIYSFNNIIKDTLSGTITGMMYPEDPKTQTQVQVNFKNNKISANTLSANTDNLGSYQITGLTGGVNVVSNLEGPYVKVFNDLQPTATHSTYITVPATHNFNWKDYDASYKQEESNLFYHTNIVHDFFTKGSPFDITSMDYQMEAWVEYDVARGQSCNAFADGTNIYFFGPSADYPTSGCESTALSSDTVYHEYTHDVTAHLISNFPYWDETGNMNEGFSDYFAASINNNPCMSENIFFNWPCLRNLENTARYPQDYNPEPHGIIFPGALWDLRELLGKDLTDSLVIRTMKLQPHSFTEFVDFMLTVDDNNADLADGTPHISEICKAFYDNHGLFSSNCVGYTENSIVFISSPLTSKFNLFDGKASIPIIGTVAGSKLYSLQDYNIKYIDINLINSNWFSERELIVVPGTDKKVRLVEVLSSNTVNIEVIDSSGTIGSAQIQIGTTEIVSDVEITLKSVYTYYNSAELSVVDSTKWFNTGVVLTGGEVINSIIATIDPTLLEDGAYKIKLVVNDGGGNSNTYFTEFVLDKEIMEGWPQKLDVHFYSSPVVGDIDKAYPGLEILAFDNEWNFYAWHADGTLVHGWPLNDYLMSLFSPSLADLDNDGDLEIVANVYRYGDIGWATYLSVFNHDRSEVEGWPKLTYDGIGPFIVPSIGDIDGGGNLEIVVGVYENIYAWHADGTLVNGWPRKLDGATLTSSALGDIDKDGFLEIAIGVRYSSTDNGNRTYVFNYDGTLADGWPQDTGGEVSPPIMGDLDNDGLLEIIAISLPKSGPWPAGWSEVYAWHADGKLVNGWPQNIYPLGYLSNPLFKFCPILPTTASPALADIDLDGNPEILVLGGCDVLYAWHANGTLVEGFPVDISNHPTLGKQGGYEFFVSSPVIGDIDSDNKMEIVAEGDGDSAFAVFALNNDGTVVPAWPKYITMFSNPSPIITDIDKDGDVEIIQASNGIFVWDLSGVYTDETMEWSMPRYDVQGTGCYKCRPALLLPPVLLPKSKIDNHLQKDVQGYLLMKIQKQSGTAQEWEWVDIQTIVNDKQTNTLRTIKANSFLALDTIWKGAGGYSLIEAGRYRVYAEFRDLNNNLIANNIYEFTVT